MSDYTVGWTRKDNPELAYHSDPVDNTDTRIRWFRVWRDTGTTYDPVTEPMTKEEAYEKLKMIQKLDPPDQKELDLRWR